MVNERLIIIGRLRQGWDRVALENPDINWTIDTPETIDAWRAVDDAAYDYIHNGGELMAVKQSFDVWAAAQISKPQEQLLF
jgi:hypothetical protein